MDSNFKRIYAGVRGIHLRIHYDGTDANLATSTLHEETDVSEGVYGDDAWCLRTVGLLSIVEVHFSRSS